MKKKLFFMAVAVLCAVQVFSQTNYYVATTGHDTNNNGLAVGTPFLTIAKAISTAAAGDVINIAAGTYQEKGLGWTAGANAKSLTIQGAGIGQTIVQATGSKQTTGTAGSATAVFHFEGSITSDITITIQNMTIQNGSSTLSGGGIRFNTGSQTTYTGTLYLTNLKISDNYTSGGSGGGGVYLQGKSTVTISGCNIATNIATTGAGGGISVAPGAGIAANVTIKKSTISGNDTQSSTGGGINITCANQSGANTIWIENSTIYGNKCTTATGKFGGGIAIKAGGNTTAPIPVPTLTINHCTIANNTTNAGVGGDGVCIDNGGSNPTYLVMNNSIVMGNTGSTSNIAQVGQNGTALNKLINNGITNSILGIISGGTWVTAGTTNNKLDAVVGDLAFAGSLSSDATPVLAIGNGSIARNYIQTNSLSPALTLDQIGNARVGNTDVGAFENQTTYYSVQTANDGNGSVSGSGNVTIGSTSTLTATGNAGYAFNAWTVSAGTATISSSTNPLTFTPTADCTISASFKSITAFTPTLSYARTASTIDVLVTNPTGYTGTITYNVLDGSDNVLSTGVPVSNQTATLVYSATGLSANSSNTYKVVAVINGSFNSVTASVVALTRRLPSGTIQVIDDFADNNMGWTGQNGPTLTIPFTNAVVDGINTSTNCAKVNIPSGKANYTGLQNSFERIEIGPNAPYQYMHVKMYRDADNGTIGLTFLARRDISQAQVGSIENLTVSTVSASGPWVDYVFDLKNAAYTSNMSIFGFYIKPNRTVGNTAVASNSYIDDVYLSNDATPSTSNPATLASTGGNINALGFTEAQLAETNLNVSSGELNVNQTTAVKSVTVAAGAKLTISAGTLTATNGITLQSSASGTATLLNSGTYAGTINAEQYLGSARNWYVSSPVSNATSPSNNMDYYYEYVEAGNNNPAGQPGSSTVYWKGLANGTTMEVGKGYIAKSNAGGTVQFSGTPNNGNITTSFNLTRDDTKGKGFNLVGNPYPSYINWSLVATANPNLDNTYYYRTKNSSSGYTFVTWNGAGSNYVVSNGSLPANTTVTRYIPPTQAFWVRVKSGTTSTAINFTNAMREHRDDNGNLMKARKQDTRASVRLQLLNGAENDELLIYQDEAASNSYDAYDSPKMMNNSASVPDLYTKAGAERLVINGLNTFTDNMELPLGFSLNAAASLKLKATEMSNFPVGTRIYLLDKVEVSQVELLPETEYSFKTTTATINNENRFSLLFKVPGLTTGIDNIEKSIAQVFVNTANQITIIASEKCSYAIYNAVGQLSAEGTINHSPFTINHSKGAYVVKVNNQSTRVVIK